jgi:hypothetical protein
VSYTQRNHKTIATSLETANTWDVGSGGLAMRLFTPNHTQVLAVYPGEYAIVNKDMGRRVTGSNKELRRILWSACAPDRLEWYMNNLRARHSLDAYMLPLLAVGTTSNEALHAEINRWFHTIQTLHQSTLELKLHTLCLRKQLPHVSAMSCPTTKQMPPATVLVNMLRHGLWDDASEWDTWCGSLGTEGRKLAKAALPLAEQRREEEAKVAAWVRKRPAAKASPKVVRSLTPFTRKRQDNLVRAGVRHTIYKSGAAGELRKRPACRIVSKRPASRAGS